MHDDSWLTGFLDRMRGTMAGLLGLFALIALSILVVWPLWYLATSHTRFYSLAMVFLAGCFLAVVIHARIRRFVKAANPRGTKAIGTELHQPEPAEHGK